MLFPFEECKQYSLNWIYINVINSLVGHRLVCAPFFPKTFRSGEGHHKFQSSVGDVKEELFTLCLHIRGCRLLHLGKSRVPLCLCHCECSLEKVGYEWFRSPKGSKAKAHLIQKWKQSPLSMDRMTACKTRWSSFPLNTHLCPDSV